MSTTRKSAQYYYRAFIFINDRRIFRKYVNTKQIKSTQQTNLQSVYISSFRSSRPEVFCKKGVLRNFAKFTGKHLLQALIKKETLAQLFSCEFCKISKNTLFYRAPPVVASQFTLCLMLIQKLQKLLSRALFIYFVFPYLRNIRLSFIDINVLQRSYTSIYTYI